MVKSAKTRLPLRSHTLAESQRYETIVYHSDEEARQYNCEQFNALLTGLKLTPAEAAAILRVNQDTVEAYVSGHKKPSDKLLDELNCVLRDRLGTAQALARFADSQHKPVHYQIVADPEPYGKREYNLPDTFSLYVNDINFNKLSRETIAQNWIKSALENVLDHARKIAKPGKIV